MRPKAKTNLEKMGFLDNDRKNPTHDEMQLWLLYNLKQIIKQLSKLDILDEDINIDGITLEVPVETQTKFIVGYLDAVILFTMKSSYFKLIVEIKTGIESFGDVLRQMNTYKSYIPERKNTFFCILTQNDKNKQAFESQKIKVLIYNKK